MTDIIMKENILSYTNFATSYNILVLETVNSTNFFLKELAKKGAPHETLVIANKQTEGRGRLGRSFFSPEDSGIYMSILLKSDKVPLSSSLLTVAAGVAVCRALNSIAQKPALIKWVNDIFIDGKKVCGILAESIIDPVSNTPDYIIVGTGLNVTTPDELFPGELKGVAGSIFPKKVTRNEIISKIIDEFKYIYETSNEENLIAEYKKYSCVLGKKINFIKNNEVYSGTAIDINIEGNLVVKLENGETITLKSGEVSLGSENFIK